MGRHTFSLFADRRPTVLGACFFFCLTILIPLMEVGVADAQLPWLHVEGKRIIDSQGNTVILHGVNFEGYEVTPYLEGGWSDHREEDYQRIAEWGFNVVRLPISWQHFETTEGVFNQSYFTNFVDKDIEWAGKHGIYVIVPFMQWFWSPYFSYAGKGYGFPSWLFEGYPNSEEGKIQSVDDFWLGKAPGGVSATLANPSMQDRMINAWKYIVERYKNNPTVVAYDLFNEPPSGSLGTDSASNYLYALIERLIGEIKAIDDNHIFLYQPISGRWDYAPRLLSTPNTVFSVHLYPSNNDATKYGYSGDVTILRNQLLGYLNLPQANPSKNWNIPILIGEFGPATSPFYSGNSLWIDDMADLYNENGFQWTYFDYGLDSGSKFSIVNSDRTEVTERADALDKPYPRVNSIPPVEFSFDQVTKLFEVTYNGIGIVQAQIYVPERYYPGSFSVNCNSSQWTKNWNDSGKILTVNASLQSTVKITISLGPASGKALLIGKVTNINTGAAIVGVTIATDGYHATTGSAGTYSIEVALGTYNLTASSNGYEEKSKTVSASEEKTYTVDFALTPAQSSSSDWRLPRNMILVGGAAVIAVAVAVVLLATRRKKRRS